MSAAELRRGEQSALHCSGTRTLQVRNPLPHSNPNSPPKPTWRPLRPFPGATLSQAPASPHNPLSPALPGPAPSVPRPACRPLPQVSPPGGGPDVAFRFGAVLDGARTQEDVFRACGVRRLGELALRG